jgi:hypothetical protein
MGNVAAFKTRITLESDQYIAGWKKVEAATTNSVGGIEAAISKGMKSWSKSLSRSIGTFFSIQLADTLLKGIDESLKNPMFNNTGKQIAYSIGDGLSNALKQIPVAGTLGGWIGEGVGIAQEKIVEFGHWMESKSKGVFGLETAASALATMWEYTAGRSSGAETSIKESREQAERNQKQLAIGSKMVADLEKQRELASAVSDADRTRVERAQRLSDLQKQLNDQMLKENATVPEIVAARDKLRAAFDATSAAQDEALKRQEREKMLADQAAEAEKERARIAEEAAKAQERAQADAEKRAEMRAAAEERREESVMNFMDDLQDALDERTMTEEQLFQKKMDRLGLDAQEQENARALNEKLKAAEAGASKTTAVSNIESIQSAVGSVKMAGTTSGLDKLAKPAEATAKATQASATHLAKLAAATGAV